MISIAICDDILSQLEIVNIIVKEYIDEKMLDAEVYTFLHPDKLLMACETKRFHIYILDMVMPMINGVQLGVEIRRLDREAQIIYVTTATEFALDSFAANPLSYLIKPLDRQKLFNTLDLAISKINMSEEVTITVKTREGLRVLSNTSIACCERFGNTVRYLLTTGEIVESLTIRCSFSKHIEPLLRDKRFLQSHESFALNMSRVESLKEQGFILRGGTFVPVAKKQYTAVRNAYLDYRLGKGEQK
ncbi:LytR/AlgR family response regulator transcription factor [Clostridium algidicarnis]|uniref:LytR/AlgR family response regulator transcription factor n=1 Tax=Clostridium algidicarnis TaxID=37659 RepID=UPI001C0BA940|nr:LytTR family DNA-binding domain-containing protein [Clostridium algidicarnis]MBU3194862.1 LytTR family DNA-binding domain-containing protein [Clostridium algidicarnis]